MPPFASAGLLLTLAAAALLGGVGCSKPAFTYALAPGSDVSSFRTIALDPRKDVALVVEGLRPLNVSDLQGQVAGHLAARGFVVLSGEDSGQAEDRKSVV